MICAYLEPMDVAGIRLLDRSIAAVGLEYIVSQIHLIPKAESYDRLLAVAEHPRASQYVTSLCYEADFLKVYPEWQNDRQEWEKSIVVPEYASPLEEVQDPHFTSACGLLPRRYVRRATESISERHHNYTKRELEEAYKEHRSCRVEQQRMNESIVYKEALVWAMKRLPHLTSIIVSRKRGNSNYFLSAFEAGLSLDVTPGPLRDDLIGASQLEFLLSAADKASLQITKLVAGSIRQFDLVTRTDFVTRSFRNLRTLHLFLLHHADAYDPGAYYFNPDIYAHQRLRLATLAPDLETLSIRYDQDCPINPPDIKHFVMPSSWHCLASATFAKMNTSEQIVITFCHQHASTLRDLALTDITLHSGRWASTFFEMRQRLDLKRINFSGIISSRAGEFWDLNHEKDSAKEVIEHYILHSNKTPRNIEFDPFSEMYIIERQGASG